MTPFNALDLVQRLAADEGRCVLYTPVLEELRQRGMDSDDLLGIVQTELGETHCTASKTTEKYYPGTTSDYYSIWVDDCSEWMFLKLLVAPAPGGGERLVITSFKKDNTR
ncbi:hypothetical protein D8770_21655 [Methylobacterium sp. DB1607]|nr:hypothetical protein [Methylobacterium sp. DB1607]